METVGPETVYHYNRKHAGKAWTIEGFTFETGDFSCKWCTGDHYLHFMAPGWTPVFASDEFDMTCRDCGDQVKS